MPPIDAIILNFDPASLVALNFILGGLLFGIALDLHVEDFEHAMKSPKSVGIGLFCQFLLLPALTFLLTLVLAPPPSIALGMILVAACPGGNLSNYFTWLARGDVALSVSMSAISTCAATFMTPLNLAFWGSMNPSTATLLAEIDMGVMDMLIKVFIILGVPLVIGMSTARWAPTVAEKLRKPFKIGSVVFFFAFVAVLFGKNFDHFLGYIHLVFLPVFLQNSMALSTGFLGSKAGGLSVPESRAVSIEVGIQNSGLGLLLVFEFFDGLGGMAFVLAWWGIWHIIAGMSLATFWNRQGVEGAAEAEPAAV